MSSGSTWVRISFGIRGLVEGSLMTLWIAIACFNLFFATLWFIRPEKTRLISSAILILSMVSICSGGGFIIGLLLAVIAAMMGLQPLRKPKSTFIGKFFRALRLDGSLFEELKHETSNAEAAFLVMAIAFLSALGCSLYASNVNAIHSSTDKALEILLLGGQLWDNSILHSAFINIGIGVFKWLFLTTIIFIIGSKLMTTPVNFDETARAVAFAYAPITLQLFLPTLYFNEPYLSYNWPLTVYIITELWAFLILVLMSRRLFNLSVNKAIGLAILSGTIYWLIAYRIFPAIMKIVEPNFEFPGISFEIQPLNMVLMMTSLLVILAFILGTFSKQQ
jgi:hypothetical protein